MLPPSPHDPFVEPSWRWLRACFLAEQAEPAWHPQDDSWVRRAVTFAAARGRCCDEADQNRLADEMPELYQAHRLFHGASSPPLLRWGAEARLLAREPLDAIARKCGLLPGTVEAYTKLFFDVLGRLDADTWVYCQVIGSKAFHGMTEQDLGIWWKLVGYGLGPVALDILLHCAPGLPPPETLAGIDEALAGAAASLFRWKELLAVHLLPVTRETAGEVLRLAAQFRASAGRAEKATEQGPASLQAAAANLLGDLPASASRPGPPLGDRPGRRKSEPAAHGAGREVA